MQAAGYFGPARVVFALLDGSDDGEIALDELLGNCQVDGDAKRDGDGHQMVLKLNENIMKTTICTIYNNLQ